MNEFPSNRCTARYKRRLKMLKHQEVTLDCFKSVGGQSQTKSNTSYILNSLARQKS